MPLADQANHVSWAVDYDCKQVSDVAAEHTHVEGRDFGERRELTPKGDSAAILTEKDDLGLDADGRAHTTYPGKPIGNSERRQVKGLQNVRTEDVAVGADVHQKTCLHPAAVAGQDLATKDRSSNTVIAEVPYTTDEHKCAGSLSLGIMPVNRPSSSG